jgi:hypothetical protein
MHRFGFALLLIAALVTAGSIAHAHGRRVMRQRSPRQWVPISRRPEHHLHDATG